MLNFHFIRDMQIQTDFIYYLTLVGMAIIHKSGNKSRVGVEIKGDLFIAGGSKIEYIQKVFISS